MAKLAVSLLLLSLVPLCLCQLNCSELNVDYIGDAFSGSNLTICTTTELQCCTEDYLDDARDEVEDVLFYGLKERIYYQFERFDDAVDCLDDYISYQFIGDLFLNTLLNRTEEDQRGDIEDAFDRLFENSSVASVRVLIDDITASLFPGYEEQCVKRIIMSHIDQRAEASLAESSSTLCRGVTTLIKIEVFLDLILYEIDTYYSPEDPTIQSLVDVLSKRSFCGRCMGNIPPLCLNICGAITRALYSPLHTRLSDQFNLLWRVARRDVEIIQQAINSIFAGINSIYDTEVATLFLEINQTCQSAPVRERSVSDSSRIQRSDDTGNTGTASKSTSSDCQSLQEVLAKLDELLESGLFDEDSPDVCVDLLEYDDGCPENVTCSSSELCTASCKCWDGDMERVNDVPAFTGLDVEDQAANQYIEPVTVGDLRELAQRLDIGTPVSDFLASENFTSTAPDELLGGDDDDDDDAAPPTVAVSMCALLLGAILAAFL